jgi:hypothetical protein
VPPICSTHRHRAVAAVRTPEAALTAVALATEAGRSSSVVIGGLDRTRQPLALLVFDEAVGADLPLAVDLVLRVVRRLGNDSAVASVFLASTGDAATSDPGPSESALYDDLDRRFAGAGIALLDWFMVTDGAALSVAHVAGRATAW